MEMNVKYETSCFCKPGFLLFGACSSHVLPHYFAPRMLIFCNFNAVFEITPPPPPPTHTHTNWPLIVSGFTSKAVYSRPAWIDNSKHPTKNNIQEFWVNIILWFQKKKKKKILKTFKKIKKFNKVILQKIKKSYFGTSLSPSALFQATSNFYQRVIHLNIHDLLHSTKKETLMN